MNPHYLIYLGALLPLGWGIAHLIPTRAIIRDFGAISEDNRLIVTMEWIVEGIALIHIGLLLAAVTAMDAASPVATVVYLLGAGCLVALALVSLFTGFRIHFLPFRLCPVIFSMSAMLITIGWNLL